MFVLAHKRALSKVLFLNSIVGVIQTTPSCVFCFCVVYCTKTKGIKVITYIIINYAFTCVLIQCSPPNQRLINRYYTNKLYLFYILNKRLLSFVCNNSKLPFSVYFWKLACWQSVVFYLLCWLFIYSMYCYHKLNNCILLTLLKGLSFKSCS